MRRLGAVGEVTGWAFDAAGRIIDGGFNERLTSVPRTVPPTGLVVGVAQGHGQGAADSRRPARPHRQRPDHQRDDGPLASRPRLNYQPADSICICVGSLAERACGISHA